MEQKTKNTKRIAEEFRQLARKASMGTDEEVNQELRFALFQKNLDMERVAELVKKGGNINVIMIGTTDRTAMHYAAMKGDMGMIRFLHGLGGDINLRTDGGLTPMDVAVVYGHNDAIRLLESFGVV
jgi:ankyrin repeat protein